MQHKLYRFHALSTAWHYVWSEAFLILVYALLVLIAPVGALPIRLTDRGLMMNSGLPGVTTQYTISFQYTSSDPIGSVDMLYCESPIPYEACVTPPGLDVSGAVLSNQSGETGYSILSKTTNHIVLTRPAVAPTSSGLSAYTFDNMINPNTSGDAFSIRLQTHTATDASDGQVDFGSVRGEVTNPIVIETQVPPMLIFCLAQQVDLGCGSTDNTYYSDLGQLSATDTLKAQSQMAVGTNASAGFAITVNGNPPTAGTHVIDAPTTPTVSLQGTDQFGINLVENSYPIVGHDPEGTFLNSFPSTDYGVPNEYMYRPGDVVAYSTNVSLMKKFTVSYILNSSPNLRAGVYTTTITYIASGRF